MQPYGYGKALYVKLKDGNIAVYAHLSAYNKKITKYLKNVQKKSGNYNQNIYLKKNQIPVKKGEVIAYTGSTGIGSPHFHFEIRDNMDRNLHTLSFYPEFKDKIFPTITSLITVAKSEDAIANGSKTYRKIKLRKRSYNAYKADTIKYHGAIGLAVNCYDQSYQTANKTGVYKLELYLDGNLFYQSKVDETYYSKNHYINLDRFFHLVKYRKKYYQKLFREPENKLKIYSHKNYGVIERELLRDDYINYEIIISDYNGNQSNINGVLEYKKTELTNEEFTYFNLFGEKDIVFNDRIYNLKSGNEIKPTEDSGAYYFNRFGQKIKLEYWAKNQNNTYKYKDFNFSLKKRRLFKNSYVFIDTLAKKKFPKLNYSSDIIYFAPLDLLIDGRLKLSVNRNLEKNESVYSWNFRKRKWNFRRLKGRSGNNPYLLERSIDIYSILQDTIKPKIEKYWVNKNYLFVKVWDDLSGIRDEKNWEIYSKRSKVIAEYDYEEMILKIERKDLKSSILSITLRDNAGNMIQKEIKIL